MALTDDMVLKEIGKLLRVLKIASMAELRVDKYKITGRNFKLRNKRFIRVEITELSDRKKRPAQIKKVTKI